MEGKYSINHNLLCLIKNKLVHREETPELIKELYSQSYYNGYILILVNSTNYTYSTLYKI